MKYIFPQLKSGLILSGILCLISLSPALASDPPWFDIGARGSVRTTWLYNKNLINDKDVNYKITPGYSGGIKLGFNYESVSLNIEALYSTYNQKFTGTGSTTWNSETNLLYLEIPLLFRYTKETSYLEIGPQWSFLQKAQQSFTVDGPQGGTYTNKVTSEKYTPKVTGLVFGWGSNLFSTDGLSLSAGIRITHSFSDIISEDGGKGLNYFNPFSQAAASYRKTHITSAGIIINIDYDLGYFAKAKCSRKRRFVFFD